MPLLHTEEQEQIRSESRRLLEQTYDPAALKRLLEAEGEYDSGFWQACRDMGWTGLATNCNQP